MTDTSRPFAEKKFTEVKGHRMAYIDDGEGAPIVFQHGNPTSSYLWRNVMPACRGLGRLIACDLIGMGDSDKLHPSGPDRYTYAEQRDFLFALWDKLGLGNDVVFVVHDWGSALGFDWANRNRDRVQGIAYMEAIVLPLGWDDFPEFARDTFRAFRSPAGEDMALRDNLFVEQVLRVRLLASEAAKRVWHDPVPGKRLDKSESQSSGSASGHPLGAKPRPLDLLDFEDRESTSKERCDEDNHEALHRRSVRRIARPRDHGHYQSDDRQADRPRHTGRRGGYAARDRRGQTRVRSLRPIHEGRARRDFAPVACGRYGAHR